MLTILETSIEDSTMPHVTMEYSANLENLNFKDLEKIYLRESKNKTKKLGKK